MDRKTVIDRLEEIALEALNCLEIDYQALVDLLQEVDQWSDKPECVDILLRELGRGECTVNVLGSILYTIVWALSV